MQHYVKRLGGAGLAVALALSLAGCSRERPEPVYEAQGLRFKPPPGWSERTHNESVVAGKKQDQVLAQYRRSVAGSKGWLRVSVAEVASATTLADCLTGHTPGPDWKREGEVENLEVGGLPAARIAWKGRQEGATDFLTEVTAVRKGKRVYYFTLALPASAGEDREQVRQAVTAASWQ